ncbi:phosphoenolpyruvate--protein phosphotransferase [Consotaella aegiceratis]|uniref:phosphoenolpyruvate--protein phosphotransferase n=1 Tax=Consotaella aegiceratis TaxID=3097961 RepID=UPI002F41DD95
MSVLKLLSPFTGRALALEESPDPVFASGALGKGIAVDPTVGELRAPCAGTIVAPHAAGHALTVRADNGAELLIHLGVDTVNLGGAGFTVHVADGQRVTSGERLVSFDIARIRLQVTSMISMMVVANSDVFQAGSVATDGKVSFGDPILTIEAVNETDSAPENGDEAAELTVPLLIAHGLHARPAALLADAAKAHVGQVTVGLNGKTVNAKSVVALMGLGTRFGDNLTIRIEGAGADATADSLLDLILSGLGDPIADGPAPEAEIANLKAEAAARQESFAPLTAFSPGDDAVVIGRSAVAGLAAGLVSRRALAAMDLPRDGDGAEKERRRLAVARAAAAARLTAPTAGTAHGAIAAAHREILDDPALVEAAEAAMDEGRSAEWAWNAACSEHARALTGLSDPRMAERAADLRDIAAQIVAELSGKRAVAGLASMAVGSIVLADEILPSEILAVSPGHIAAILMRDGGPTSHAAILAAGLGIPTIVAIGPEADRIPDGAAVIVDAGKGRIVVYPKDEALADARSRIALLRQNQSAQRRAAQNECRMADGTRIEVFANLGHAGEGKLAVAEGAEGCGLLRTEFLFLDRTTAPSEDEQVAEYQALADELAGRPLIIRLLDVGGDKPLAYLPILPEENPFLGLRGIRVGLAQPELLRTQIRAILRVKPYGVVRIMAPMISSLAEMTAVRAMVEEESQALGRSEAIEIGAMVEVPAAAVTAAQLTAVCDFFSVGTNDLTQYTLAMDRGNPAVAPEVDALHPGVLGLVRMTVEGAAARDRLVAVCGAAASDPIAVSILVGLGVRELSVAPSAIPQIKALLSQLSFDSCHELAMRAIAADSPAAVRKLALSGQVGFSAPNVGSDRQKIGGDIRANESA